MLFNCFILHLPSIKWMGEALVAQHVMSAYHEDKCNAVLATKGTPDSSNKTKHFSYKGEWVNV